MKRIILLLLCIIIIAGSVSAFEFDNVKDYDSRTKEITITNAFGLGSDIAKIKLNTPINYRVPGGYGKVAEFEVRSFDNYISAFKELELYDRNKNNQKFTKSFDYKYLTYENVLVNDYSKVCSDSIAKNGTTIQTCNSIISGSHTERKEQWNLLTTKDFTDGQITTIGIFTFVEIGESVEWIPNFFGVRINEWATWTEDLSVGLIAYYALNETTGTNAEDSFAGQNGTLTNMEGNEWNTTGKIGAALEFDHTSDNTECVVVSDSALLDGIQSVSLWYLNRDTGATADGRVIFSKGNDADPLRTSLSYSDDTQGFRFFDDDFGVVVSQGIPSSVIEDYHLVITLDGTNMTLYVNGSQIDDGILDSATMWDNAFDVRIGGGCVNTRTPHAQIDEVGVWNITLTGTQVTQLFNEDIGLSLTVTTIPLAPTVNLNSPEEALNTTLTSLTFNGTAFDPINLTEVSIFLDDLINQTNSSGLNNSNYLFTIDDISDGTHNWTFQACNNQSLCTNATRTFTVSKILILAEDFSATTIEGATESFLINVSVRPGLQLGTTNLVYNGTENEGTVTNTAGQNFTVDRNLLIPSIAVDTNVTFFWNFSLSDGTFTISDSNNQTIQNIGLDDCSVNSVLLLNYTLVDEESQTFLDGSGQNTSIEIDVNVSNFVTMTSITRFNQTFNETNPAEVCLNIGIPVGIVYRMDTTTRYDSAARTPEFHHIQNFTLSNTTLAQNITLFDLLSADSTEFLITIKGTNFLPVSGGLIDITRQYVGEGVFKSVEVLKTDDDGQAIGHFDTDAVKYTLIISNEGIVLAIFSNVAVICEDVTIGDCRINLNALLTGVGFEDWDEVSGLTFTTSFDESAREITTTFTTLSGASSTVSSNSTKFDRFGNETVCTDLLTSSSGTLTCTIPNSFGNVTVVQRLFNNGQLIDTKTFSIQQSAREIFGNTGIILTILLMLTIPFMFISDKIGLLFGGIIGLILSGLLLFMDTGSILGASSAILWFIIAAGILMWRISTRST